MILHIRILKNSFHDRKALSLSQTKLTVIDFTNSPEAAWMFLVRCFIKFDTKHVTLQMLVRFQDYLFHILVIYNKESKRFDNMENLVEVKYV